MVLEPGRIAAFSSKAELRSSALKRRNSIEAQERADFASRLAVVGPPLVLECLPSLGKPVTAVFSPIGSEPDARGLALALHAAGVRLVLPVDLSHGSALTFRGWVPGDRLAFGPLGIAEPLSDAPELEPDVLVLPLVAFDRRGHRIGYGAGNYDRTLAALRKRKQVRVIGVAYAVQEERVIPNEPHDQPVDLVLTDRNVFLCQS